MRDLGLVRYAWYVKSMHIDASWSEDFGVLALVRDARYGTAVNYKVR